MNYSGKVEEFFEKSSSEIYSFASKYNLKVRERPQYSESWELGFKHPKKGHGFISVSVLPNDSIVINELWVVYVYETFSMYSKNKNFRTPESNEVGFLSGLLEKAIQEMISWNSEQLAISGQEGALKESWSNFKTKADWEKAFEWLPKEYPKGWES